jgi:hypothetical protein
LRETVESLPRLGVDHLCALDGPYAQWPGATGGRSSQLEHAVLRRACCNVGIGVTIESGRLWPTEMEKRTHLFRMGDRTEADWFLVIDADTVVLHTGCDVKARLAELDRDVAVSRFVEPRPSGSHKEFELRNFFRAIPGITVTQNHYTYETPDGRRLWGRHPCEPATEIPVLFEHRSFLRPVARFQRSRAYYKARDESAIEAGTCEICGKPARSELPTDWRFKGISEESGQVQLTSSWISVCPDCEPQVRRQNERTLREEYGLDPRVVQVTFEKAGAA